MDACPTQPSDFDLGDWVEVRDLPWSYPYVYGLLKRYPKDLKTVILGASGGGGKRFISRSSLSALMSRLADEQSAQSIQENRSVTARKNRKGRKAEQYTAPAEIDIDFPTDTF